MSDETRTATVDHGAATTAARCGEQNRRSSVRCIRPQGHDGQHRGVQLVPTAFWWERKA